MDSSTRRQEEKIEKWRKHSCRWEKGCQARGIKRGEGRTNRKAGMFPGPWGAQEVCGAGNRPELGEWAW